MRAIEMRHSSRLELREADRVPHQEDDRPWPSRSHTSTYDPADHRPAPRRYAWTVFAILFALMVVDYVDRQVVVSMFSHLKAQWSLSDGQLGALVSIVSITVALGAVPLSLLADRWSRVKSIFLMALVWSLATIACAFAASYAQLLAARGVVGLGEAAYGTVGAALLASSVSGADAQHGARRLPRGRHARLGARRGAGRLHRRALGLAGGLRRGRHSRPRARCRLPAGRARLQDRRAARRSGPHGGAHRLSARAVVAELLRPRTALITCIGAGLQLLVVSTTYAWLPSYLQPLLRPRAGPGGLKTGLVVLVGGVGALVVERAGRPADAARFPRARLYVPAVAAVLTTVFMFTRVRACLPPGNAQFALIVAGGFDDGRQHRPDRRRRHRRRPSGRCARPPPRSCRSRGTCSASPAGRCSPACCPMRTDCSSRWRWCRCSAWLAAVVFVLAARTYESDLQQRRRRRAPRSTRTPRAPTRLNARQRHTAMNASTAARPARPPARASRRAATGIPTGSRSPSSIRRGPRRSIALAIAPAVAGALDKKTIELIGIALDASCTHLYAPGVRRHIQRALKAGATKEEITAVLQLAMPAGPAQHVRRRADPARGAGRARAARQA